MSLPLTPSRVGTFDIIAIQDPDLAHPDAITRGEEESDDSWSARLAARHVEITSFARRIAVARESGDLADVLRPGGTPTRFHVRQIPGETWAALQRIAAQLGVLEIAHLLVRIALVGASNWIPGFSIGKRVEHRNAEGVPTGIGQVADVAVIRKFYDVASASDADEILIDLAHQIRAHRENHTGN